ncbi:hypothetical protein [Candidatus Enterovibrio altilux]|uniref:hypothetical protein n=1 Tax=Candidatus Enterovibrio altilux TaxID=1927128 RepID=UPI0012383B66|nr:hypothetical protein [Candidatus Enterovibrio luxaltus]
MLLNVFKQTCRRINAILGGDDCDLNSVRKPFVLNGRFHLFHEEKESFFQNERIRAISLSVIRNYRA